MEIFVSLSPLLKHLLSDSSLFILYYFHSLDFETAGYMGTAFVMEECMDMDMDMDMGFS